MPSGKYDRKTYEKICEYCDKSLAFTVKGWNSHNTAHIQKGDQKLKTVVPGHTVNPPPPSTAIIPANTCGECLAQGKTKTFKNAFGLTVHRSRMHSTAIVPAEDLTCPECKAEGIVKTFTTTTLQKRHRSRVHKVRGPNYHALLKYRSRGKKQHEIVSIAHRGDSNGYSSESIDYQEAQRASDEDKINYFIAGHATARIEVFATSLGKSASVLTERVLSILSVGINPSGEELRSKNKVPHLRRAPSA